MYSSHHSGEFEIYDMVLYEPVIQVENFQYKTLVLIGQFLCGIGPGWLYLYLIHLCVENFLFSMLLFFLGAGGSYAYFICSIKRFSSKSLILIGQFSG